MRSWQAARMHRGLSSLLVCASLLLGCGPDALGAPLGFSLDYATGSIPPPYNYRYSIDVVFDDAGAQVDYLLEYRYREGMSEAELTELGYSARDDIRWSGSVGPPLADRWREVTRTSRLTGNGEPAPGGDSMLVRVSETEDTFRAGVPVDRAPWEEIAREVDQLARAELGIERHEP